MNKLLSFFKIHTSLIIYTLVFGILINGLVQTSGAKYLLPTLSVLLSCIASYFLLFFLFKKKNFNISLDKLISKPLFKKLLNINILIYGSIALVIAHLISLGGLPGFESFKLLKTSEIVALRRSITYDSSAFWNYASSFNIKAFLPFSLFLLYRKKKTALYWIYLLVIIIYAFALMQKSYILTLLFPVIIISIWQKRFLYTFKYFVISGLIIVGLVYSANPIMRGGFDDSSKVQAKEVVDDGEYPYFVRVLIGLSERTLVTPGEIVSEWFDNIPSKKPFLNGCGYRFVAPFIGCEYQDYAIDLYPIIKPHYAERGLKGSVNSASFMYDYSNFGLLGLIISGVSLAIIFLIISFVFENDFISKLALNFFPIFMLSSGALTSILLSGGWMMLILLFILFKREFLIE